MPIVVTNDASDSGIGAVFEQFVEGAWKPLALFSKQLRVPESKRTVSLVPRHKTFKFFLRERRVFTAFTDYEPLMGKMLNRPILGRHVSKDSYLLSPNSQHTSSIWLVKIIMLLIASPDHLLAM